MLKVLAACGNGMGSSMIIKMKIQKVLKDMNVNCKVSHASVGEAKTMAENYDLILVADQLKKNFNIRGDAKVVGLVNLLSEDEIINKVSKVLKEIK